MPCGNCAHFLDEPRTPGQGLCRLKSDSIGMPFATRKADLCEFFELDASSLDEAQMTICRHCGSVAFVTAEIELCADCQDHYNLHHFFREEGGSAESIVRFNCARSFRERWLKHRLEVKQGGKSS